MGRTIPSFRIALDLEEWDWKPFRNALDKSEGKKFDDEMFDIPRFYISACANSVQYIRMVVHSGSSNRAFTSAELSFGT